MALALCLGVLCLTHQIPGACILLSPSPSVTSTPREKTATPALVKVAPAPTSAWTPAAVSKVTPMTTQTGHPITLTIVYDNNPLDAQLKTAWGFACLIETTSATVLFDTGGDGPMLLGNLRALGFDPRRIDAVALSHAHDDHTGGLNALLDINDALTAFIPQSFPAEFKSRVTKRGAVVSVSKPMTITEHIRTMGEMGASIIEQSLILETAKGLIVVTGCAHPGIVEIVRQAKSYDDVYLVLGGFHLGDKSAQQVEAIIAELKHLGVRKVAPCHCTGERAIQQFKAAFGADFVQAGAGLQIAIPAKD